MIMLQGYHYILANIIMLYHTILISLSIDNKAIIM